MENMIIILILAALIFLGVRGSVKHFRGEGGCCGGGKRPAKIKKKVLEHAKMGELVLHIQGMHCDNCRRSVTNALNHIDGVSAEVNLKKKQAVVSYDRPVDENRLKQAVESAGFTVSAMERR